MEYEKMVEPDRAENVHNLQIENRKKRYKRKKRQQQFILVVAVLFVVILVVVLRICFKSDKLEGTWHYDSVTSYQFDGKGGGKLILPEKEYPFSYKVSKDEVSIDFESEAARDCSYVFSTKGNQLTLASGREEDSVIYILTK